MLRDRGHGRRKLHRSTPPSELGVPAADVTLPDEVEVTADAPTRALLTSLLSALERVELGHQRLADTLNKLSDRVEANTRVTSLLVEKLGDKPRLSVVRDVEK